MNDHQPCCWVCGQPATDFFLLSLHEDGRLPEVVPVCGASACEQTLRSCAQEHGGLKGHPCRDCEALAAGRCGCVSS